MDALYYTFFSHSGTLTGMMLDTVIFFGMLDCIVSFVRLITVTGVGVGVGVGVNSSKTSSYSGIINLLYSTPPPKKARATSPIIIQAIKV